VLRIPFFGDDSCNPERPHQNKPFLGTKHTATLNKSQQPASANSYSRPSTAMRSNDCSRLLIQRVLQKNQHKLGRIPSTTRVLSVQQLHTQSQRL